MSHLAPLLGLDPLRTEAVMPAPFLEHRPQADDVEERLLTHHPPNRRAVIRVEVAMDRDAASLGEGDGLFDLAPLEIALVQRLAHAVRSGQIGRKAQSEQGRSACSGPR